MQYQEHVKREEGNEEEKEKSFHPIRSIVVESRINRMGKNRKTWYATLPAKLTQQPLFVKAFAVGDLVDVDFGVDAETITIRKRGEKSENE